MRTILFTLILIAFTSAAFVLGTKWEQIKQTVEDGKSALIGKVDTARKDVTKLLPTDLQDQIMKDQRSRITKETVKAPTSNADKMLDDLNAEIDAYLKSKI